MSLLTRAKKILRQQEQEKEKPRGKKEATVATATTKEEAVTSSAPTLNVISMLTEKSLRVQDQNTVVFRVKLTASKGQIATAIFQQFGVKPKSIRTARFKSKERRRGQIIGFTQPWKKAYVKVDDVSKFTSVEE